MSKSSVSVAISPNTNFLNFSNSSLRLSYASFHSLLGAEVGGAGVGEGAVTTAAAVAVTGGVSDRLRELGTDSFGAIAAGGGCGVWSHR